MPDTTPGTVDGSSISTAMIAAYVDGTLWPEEREVVEEHLTICDDVVVTGRSFVNSSIRKPGYYSSGLPVDETTRFRKNAARFQRLDEFVREVRKQAQPGADPSGNEE